MTCEARCNLAAGDAAAAAANLAKLDRRGISGETLRKLRQITAAMQSADQSARRGHFATAAADTQRAAALAAQHAPGTATMESLSKRLNEQAERLAQQGVECQRLSAELHTALAGENWPAVLCAADALLAIAPQHVAAGQARRRAWQAVGMNVTLPHRGERPGGHVSLNARAPQALPVAGYEVQRRRPRRQRSTQSVAGASEVDTVSGKTQPQRSLLWVDAVGGYLVCFDDCVALGQPAAGDPIAVPILADLSRRHATIRREAGAYVLDPLHRTLVDGREIREPFVLADNQRIQLGEGVRLRFTKPHALSATARLVLESHHKTQPTADAVLLLADSLVLGRNRHCHVECHEWEHDVVIYRQSERLYCRADRPVWIDGVECATASELREGARVEGEEFAFTWEKV
jgi:hypothetical protein